MKILILLGVLFITACSPEPDSLKDQLACTPVYITTSPDGVNLWYISAWCSKVSNTVYFSSSGTQYKVSSGKTSRTEIVPNK